MAKMSDLEIGLLSVLFLWSIVCSLVVMHVGRYLWIFRDEHYLSCRWSRFDSIYLVCTSGLLCITRGFSFLNLLIYQDQDLNELSMTHFTLESINTIIAAAANFSFLFIITERAFYQYFIANHSVKIGLAEWRSMIDDSLVTEEMSWFIRNKHTLGNKKFLNKITMVMVLLVTSISFGFRVISGREGFQLIVLFVLVVTLPLMVLSGKRYPEFKDTVKLKDEKVLFLRAVFILTPTWIILNLIPSFFGWNWNKNRTSMIWHAFFFRMFVCFMFPVYLTICTIVVISWFETPSLSVHLCGYDFALAFVLPSENFPRDRFLSVSKRDSSETIKPVRLHDVFISNNSFRAFMAHLFAEFSYENALCLIECIKFREKAMEFSCGKAVRISTAQLTSDLQFCDDIINAKSSLVSQIKSAVDVEPVAILIAQRYLQSDSPFQVNISYRMMSEINEDLNDPSLKVEYCIFDNLISECFCLLKSSLSRFGEHS